MIAPGERFGRSASLHFAFLCRLPACTLLICLLILVNAGELSAIGSSGWFTTMVKFEYQYTDYDEYGYHMVEPEYPSREYSCLPPYVADFPEHRSIARIIQSFGPLTSLEARHENSDLREDKHRDLYYLRLDREVIPMTTLYVVYQHLDVVNDTLDSRSCSGGNMVSAGVEHDRSGWIKGEASLSCDHNRSSDGLLAETVMPMAQLRWSINSVTAISGRWDGYFASSESGDFAAHAFTVFISRYLPTQTAVHLFGRYYTNDAGIESIAPSFEVAQYVRWNLTLRLTYRFYRNWFEGDAVPDFIDGSGVSSHSARAYVEWQATPDIKLHLKFRRYVSDQDIRMNTYLLGFEYEL